MAPTNLEKAVTDREQLKSTIAWLTRKVSVHTTTPLTLVETDHYLAESLKARDQVAEIHGKIRLLAAPEDIPAHDTEYCNLLDQSTALILQVKTIRATFPTPSPTTNQSSSRQSSSSGPASEMKLPRLQLPPFSGNLNDWLSFHDLFATTVHSNISLSNSQKLTYLRSLVTGEAARLIQSIPSTDANYEIAWKLLTERFQNDRELFFSTMQRLVGQPNVQPDSSSSLRSLIDTSKECIRSLETLKLPIDQWDGVLVYLMAQKLDSQSRQFWELSLKDTAIPVFKEFMEFLEQRARALAAGATCNSSQKTSHQPKGQDSSRRTTMAHHTATSSCKICSGNHFHFKCKKFIAMSVHDRIKTATKQNLCHNCLREDHFSSQCTSPKVCLKCQQKHHTLLHRDSSNSQAPASTAANYHSYEPSRGQTQQTLLATAIINVLDQQGNLQQCRALLDGGSTASFISEECIRRLGLPRRKSFTRLVGVSSSHLATTKGIVEINVRPHFSKKEIDSFPVCALILPRVTGHLPLQLCNPNEWPHLSGLKHADPDFHKPAAIDILLGGDVFWNILQDGKIEGRSHAPTGRQSTLGWLVAGSFNSKIDQIVVHHTTIDLDTRLQQFWELESVPTTNVLTKDERLCEQHFVSTHTRDSTGRFVVKYPFKQSTPILGQSRDIAIRRLKGIERRLSAQPGHQKEYLEFMNEYIKLGHMERIPTDQVQLNADSSYYIPHHFVLKESSTTTKFRVVFDASAKTSNGISLNDTLLVGPTIQDSLFSILMRFRVHPFAFTADVTKMYRQILIAPEDQDKQRIVWRRSPNDPISDYKLSTVTYGTASAPYHATRTLRQLALDQQKSYPLGAAAALKDFYMDDVMTGGPSLEKTKIILDELRNLTANGKFELRKFSASHPSLINAVPENLRETQTSLSLDDDNGLVKTLGLYWIPMKDAFTFRVTLPKSSSIITKRVVLSETAKTFDPLGWIAPTIIKAKILFQALWKLDIHWDEALPNSIKMDWLRFRNQLPVIQKISLDRCIIPENSSQCHLFGFCDASESAYAAVVYVRADHSTNSPTISLISAKTRVAPVKQVSLPRLELCGALLLAQLVQSVQESHNVKFNSVHAWTDSTVVLGWLHSPPSRWKTFVANRVTQIQEIIPPSQWSHVDGNENPADCASRGIYPDELVNHQLWWKGPSWLRDFVHSPSAPFEVNQLSLLEEKRTVMIAHALHHQFNEMFNRVSTLLKIQRVTAWCIRFIHNCSSQLQERKGIPDKIMKVVGPLSVGELDQSLLTLTRIAQKEEFQREIACLELGKEIPNKSKLLPLRPFLDSTKLLRVGGRLRHSSLPQDQKNPAVLPRHHRLTQLIIIHEHYHNLHAGPQLLLSIIQRRFWIVNAKDAIRQQVRKCITCARHGARPVQQLMGDLPASRVTQARPFLNTGIDYAGPFQFRDIAKRSRVMRKAYLALFICFTTRAVHLEVVSDMTTAAFIAVLKRFTARRGKPSQIYSDCGTNFVGANRELKEWLALASTEAHNQTVSQYLSKNGIQWNFNPPSAPHFGGLWEAGVKSVKFHLHRIVGSARLTFEELTTVMAQIEACLNSRPLTPMSTDPSDLDALTPGHFLIGAPLVAIPEPDLTTEKQNRLSRWQFSQQLVQHFWRRWSHEFLSRLQQRPKWLKHRSEIQVNDLVLIRDDRLPPLQWNLGRVITIHPGEDGITRVVTIKTANGETKRPIVKLCLLPIPTSSDSENHEHCDI